MAGCQIKNTKKHSPDTLRAAFNKCANPSDWKAPIDYITSRIFGCYPVDIYVEAIEYFTATDAKITELGNGSVRIQSIGYRAGPAC